VPLPQALLHCPKLQALQISSCPRLETLMVWSDELRELDLTGAAQLPAWLRCGGLAALWRPGCAVAAWLRCGRLAALWPPGRLAARGRAGCKQGVVAHRGGTHAIPCLLDTAGCTGLVTLKLHCPNLASSTVPPLKPAPAPARLAHPPLATLLQESCREVAHAAAAAKEQQWRTLNHDSSMIPGAFRPLA
jgi:hypothetical protein